MLQEPTPLPKLPNNCRNRGEVIALPKGESVSENIDWKNKVIFIPGSQNAGRKKDRSHQRPRF